MRTLSELIEEVRFNTGNVDNPRFSDDRLIKFFNSAQRAIQKIIYNSNPSSSLFDGVETYTITNAGPYDLPDDIYAISAIKHVQPMTNGTLTKPLEYIDSREKNQRYGYYVMGKQLFLAPTTMGTSFSSFDLTYTKRLEDATSVSDEFELPEVCEDYLMLFVERKIQRVDSSSDLATTSAFTEKEEQEIIKLFANHHRDIMYPTMVDTAYVSW